MRILITGSTGFVGKHLLKTLEDQKHELILLVREIGKVQSGNHYLISVNDDDWKQKIKDKDPEVVIHLASFLTSSDSEDSIDKLISSNLLFGTQLLNALSFTSVKYFINTGTFAEYLTNNHRVPEPAYLYAATKTAFRSILQYYQSVVGFKTINIIPYTIYGGIDTQKKIIDIIFNSTYAVEPLKMSPGEQVLDFIHIDDVVDFYNKLLLNLDKVTSDYTELHVGSGKGTTPRQIAALIESKTGRKANIVWGGLPYRKRDTMYSVAIDKNSSALFEWDATINIETGIEKYLQQVSNG